MNIAKALSGGDRRTVGRTHEVVAYAMTRRQSVPELVAALENDDIVVLMRAADALEKLSAAHADWLDPFAQDIRHLLASVSRVT